MDTPAQQSSQPQPQSVPEPSPVTKPADTAYPISTHPEQGARIVEQKKTVESTADVEATPSHPDVAVAPELQEVGVEKGADAKEQKLASEVTNAGVKLVDEPTAPATPSVAAPREETIGSLSYTQAAASKKGSVKNAFTWLATFVLRQFQKKEVTDRK